MQTLLKETDYEACLTEQQKSDWKNHAQSATYDVWHFLTSPDWRAGAENSNTRNNPTPSRQVTGPAEIQAQLDLLSDPEAGYSAAHELAIMSLANESIVPALINLLQPGSDQVPTKAYWALVALRKIGLSNAKAAIPAVIGTLAGDEDLRWEAIKVLAGAGAEAKTAIPQLIEVAGNGKYADSQWAIITLGRIGPPARDAVPALTAMFDGDHRYKIDVARALWKIDSAQATKLIPEIIWEIERQRNASGPNQQMGSEFFSSIELLGEIGPEAKSAIPALRMQLQGGARFHAAWSLWRIDPTFTDVVTPVLAGFLDQPATRDNRLDRLAVRQRWRVRAHTVPFDRKAAAVGALWQIHPDKRRELEPVLRSLLLDWEKEKILNEWTAETRALIPALEDLLKNSTSDKMKWIILEALQEINSTDPGSNH
jgi:hypothetical protein